MINLLAGKSVAGQISFNKAKMHLARHEWGLARMAIEEGINKGGLYDQGEAEQLLQEIRGKLFGITDPVPEKGHRP